MERFPLKASSLFSRLVGVSTLGVCNKKATSLEVPKYLLVAPCCLCVAGQSSALDAVLCVVCCVEDESGHHDSRRIEAVPVPVHTQSRGHRTQVTDGVASFTLAANGLRIVIFIVLNI